jgi:TetR/AcrR family transcriptional regulator, regulator of autoinduction and epiphytic fitness
VDSNSTATVAEAEVEGSLPLDVSVADRRTPHLETAAIVDDEPAADGRVARGQRTRRNVADALVALLAESDTEPTARVVAERAGVSLRLVFHHFADMDDLYAYVAAMQLRQEWSTLPRLSPDLDLATRIERTATQRATLFEKVGPVRRAIARRASSPGVKQATAAADALLLEQLKHTFTPELDVLAESDRAEHLEAMDTAASWEAWDRMRRTSGLQVRSARRVMERLLSACCQTVGDPELVRAAGVRAS